MMKLLQIDEEELFALDAYGKKSVVLPSVSYMPVSLLSTSSSFNLQDYADYDFLKPYLGQVNSAKCECDAEFPGVQLQQYAKMVTLVRCTLRYPWERRYCRINHEDQDNVCLNMQAVKAMKQFKVSNPLVDSMVLVRTQDEFVLSTSSSFSGLCGYDFLKPYLGQVNSEAKWSAMRNFREFSFNSMRHVVTWCEMHPSLPMGRRCAVNIKVDAIQQFRAW